MKQTVFIYQATPFASGKHSQYINFRFQPKKLIVRQIGIEASAVAYFHIYCRQISPDILIAASAQTSLSTITTVNNEFELSHTLQNGDYTFEFMNNNNVLATTLAAFNLVLEFSD